MATVKFFRGPLSSYTASPLTYANGIYFANEGVIKVGDKTYGVTPALAELIETMSANLSGVIADVEWVSPDTIRFKNLNGEAETSITLPLVTNEANGLMSVADKAILDTLNGAASVVGSVKLQIATASGALVGTDEDLAANDTIKGAKKYTDTEVAKIKLIVDNLEGAVGEGGSVETQIDAKINALNVADEAVSTLYVSAVSENAGKITVNRANLISEDERVLSVNAAGELHSNLNLVWENNYLYLKGKDGNTLAEVNGADFVKDGMLESAELDVRNSELGSSTYLVLTFNTAATGKQPIEVDVTSLIDVYKAGDGIAVDGNKLISVVKHTDSEDFLEITADGIKITGVSSAIATAKSEATTELNVKTDGHVKVSVNEGSAGQKVYEITESDIASAAALANEVERATLAEQANATAIANLTGTGVNSVDAKIAAAKEEIGAYTVNSKAISTNPTLSGADIALTGYVVPENSNLGILATDSINAAIIKLEEALTWIDLN